MRAVESDWVSLVSMNYKSEQAIVQLKNEIYQVWQEQGEAKKNLARLLKILLNRREVLFLCF